MNKFYNILKLFSLVILFSTLPLSGQETNNGGSTTNPANNGVSDGVSPTSNIGGVGGTTSSVAVPEPFTLLVVGGGLLAAAMAKKMKKNDC